jgi:hypothetical protein
VASSAIRIGSSYWEARRIFRIFIRKASTGNNRREVAGYY